MVRPRQRRAPKCQLVVSRLALPQIVNGIERGLGVASADMVALAFDGVMRAAQLEAKFRRT